MTLATVDIRRHIHNSRHIVLLRWFSYTPAPSPPLYGVVQKIKEMLSEGYAEIFNSESNNCDVFFTPNYRSPLLVSVYFTILYFQMYRSYGPMVYLSMSADATCYGLRSYEDGPFTMQLSKGTSALL